MSVTKTLLHATCLLVVLLAGFSATAQDIPDTSTPSYYSAESTDPSTAYNQPSESTSSQTGSSEPSTATPATPPATTTTPATTESDGVKRETVTERYPNGNTKIERQVTQDAEGNYVNHGTYTMYDVDGKVLKTGEYRNGQMHGRWTQTLAKDDGHLFSTGQETGFRGPFVSEASFIDGELDGTWTIKDAQGQNIIEWNFARGDRAGQWTWWYPNGQKHLTATYRNGVLNGDVQEWETDGRVASQNTYIDGKCLVKTVGWYSLGQKHFEGNYLRIQSMPEPTYDWSTSTAKSAAPAAAEKDQKHGVWVVWHRNGNKKTEGQYDHDMPIGRFTWWYDNGQKQAEGEYLNGVKNGTWLTWHANGLKESQGEYQNGNLTTKWMHWNADGKVVEVVDPSHVRSEVAKDGPKADRTGTRTVPTPTTRSR